MNSSVDRRLKTHMTQVFFECPGSTGPTAMRRPKSPQSKEYSDVFLFDDLLGGGIVIPDDIIEARLGGEGSQSNTPGLLMLVTGAPGSGKTTFALELCYRLASSDNSGLDKRMKEGLSSIYVSAEASTSGIIQNAVSYGWDKTMFSVLPPGSCQVG